MFREVGILGAAVACVLVGLFFEDQLGGILGFFRKPVLQLVDLELALVGRRAGMPLLIVGVKTNWSAGSLLLFVLFVTHALVGAVELGTDNWIQNITGNILTPAQGKILFVFTSLLMFSLRFCADFIERQLKISPVQLLMICGAGFRRPARGRRYRDVWRDDGPRHLRRRQDVLLADDAAVVGDRGRAPSRCRSWAASA